MEGILAHVRLSLVVAPAQQPGAMAHMLARDDVIGGDVGDEHRLIRRAAEPNS